MLVGDEEFVHETKICLCAMFGFLLGYVHVSKDVAYGDNKLSSIPSTKSHHLAPKDCSGWLTMASIE
jgi:hypothetical protein